VTFSQVSQFLFMVLVFIVTAKNGWEIKTMRNHAADQIGSPSPKDQLACLLTCFL
jgi:hypothetical protein